MRIPFITPRRREYSLEPLSVADSQAVAVLHQEDFVRPWSDVEFEALLEQDTVFGYRLSYRRLLEVQARLLGRHLLGEIDAWPQITPR